MEQIGEHREYRAPDPLDVADLAPDPIAQFRAWLQTALTHAGAREAEAMVLATTGADGPRCRYVLLRGLDERGFAFYTSYDSAKARDIEGDPRVALTFAWLVLHRQVRVAGRAERLPTAESDAYFGSRPRGSRIGAWASPQSAPLDGRAELDARVRATEERFAGTEDIPRPPHWGGYLVRPDSVEFWQGRPDRLHDRLRYRRDGGAWVIERLGP